MLNDRIQYELGDGIVRQEIAGGIFKTLSKAETIVQLKNMVTGRHGVVVFTEIQVDDLPSHSGLGRECWKIQGNTIIIDMVKAQNIQRNRIRAERENRWREIDTMKFDADELTGQAHADAKNLWKAKRQKFRDAPQHQSIADASTVDELAAITFDSVTT